MINYTENMLSIFNIENRIKTTFPMEIINLLSDSVLCAGGAARSIMTKEQINDYDLFFTDLKSFNETFKKLESISEIKFKCPENKFISLKYKNNKIQLIKPKLYNDPNDLISSFDFTITQFATNGKMLFTYYKSLIHTRKKYLRIHKITYPAASIKRITKYINYGFKPHPDLFTDIVADIWSHSVEIIDPNLVYID